MPFLSWLDSTKAGAPRWIQRGAGGDFLRAVAVTLDAVVESARQAVKLRFPRQTSPDGLVAIGEERGEARASVFVYEDDTAFGERVRTAWERRRSSGAKPGLVATFEAFGFPSFAVYDKGEILPSKRWHAWVVLPYGGHPWGPGPVCGDGTLCGDGSTAGSSARVNEVSNLRQVTASWVPPHARVFLRLQIGDGAICGDGSECGDGSVCGGDEPVHIRLGKATLS